MGKIFRGLLSIIVLFTVIGASALEKKRILYKQVENTGLYLEIIRPEKNLAGATSPAIIFFFGGGWTGGSTGQFEPHAQYFASKGITCFLAEYRVKGRNQTSPFEALMDARSAIRFIRAKSTELGIDPDRIIASGGSAGGHLAAATALAVGFDDPADDLSASCVPNALVLFNPVIDNGPGGYGYDRIGEQYKDFSPLHNIRKGAPPTIFFLGSNDKLIPVETANYYRKVMEKVGSRCDLHIFEGEEHGFFNYTRSLENYHKTIELTHAFLTSLGYIR